MSHPVTCKGCCLLPAFLLSLSFILLLSSRASEAAVYHKKADQCVPIDRLLKVTNPVRIATCSLQAREGNSVRVLDLAVDVPDPFQRCFMCFCLEDGRNLCKVQVPLKSLCSYKDKYFKPGDSFRRGCDKCFCHELGFYCFAPMKPTSWPKKCRRVRTDCGYTVVYKENPLVVCRAYSWIG